MIFALLEYGQKRLGKPLVVDMVNKGPGSYMLEHGDYYCRYDMGTAVDALTSYLESNPGALTKTREKVVIRKSL